MKKLKFIMSAVMLTACMSAFIGAGGATAFAYEGEEPAIECEHEYTEETVSGTCYENIPVTFAAIPIRTIIPRRTGISLTKS